MPRSAITAALLSLLALPLAAAAGPSGNGNAAAGQLGKAIYFMTNENNNAVIAVSIGRDGKLGRGTTTPTGGQGDVSVDGAANAPAAKDGLVSQSSVAIAGNNLFAVNSKSNTVSMFAINPQNPTQLAPVGKPAAVPAEFVNTVAASAKNNMVCAAATGAKAGVACANFNGRNGIGKMDQLRGFNLGQTTPPVGPENTVSQVFFSNDENMLFATVKGDPAKNNTGFLAAFPVQNAGNNGAGARATTLSQKALASSPGGTAVLFGSLPIPNTANIFATDASFGGSILSVQGNGQGALRAAQAIDGQKATCWVTISTARNSAFVTDVGNPTLVEMSLNDAKIKDTVDVSSTGATGLIDLRAAGDFIYALAPGDGQNKTQVLVMSAGANGQSAKPIQAFDTGALGGGSNSQGMAILQ